MAAVETQQSLADQILQPHSAPLPQFTFDAYLHTILPTLGAPSKVARPICPDFKTSSCPRGPACPDRHYVPPNERSGIGHLICKHYQRGLCKKGDACEFAHTFNLRDERECKEFSRYGICPQGDDCTYLHVPPTSTLRLPACPHYTRGFCPLGPYCAMRHIKHPRLCPFYLAGFCPNGRAHPPDADKVVSCEFGAHAKWIKDEDLHPRKPEVRKIKSKEEERREQEEREEEFYAEEERRRERAERGEGGMGRWGGGRRRALSSSDGAVLESKSNTKSPVSDVSGNATHAAREQMPNAAKGIHSCSNGFDVEMERQSAVVAWHYESLDDVDENASGIDATEQYCIAYGVDYDATPGAAELPQLELTH